MTVPHPIPYQGSKRNLAPEILPYFPPAVSRLIEPFAGSAALSLAAAYHQKAVRFLLNDINPALMRLWDAIIAHPERLAAYYGRLWLAQQGHERTFYDHVRMRFNRTQQPYYFLYLLARCVKASIRYNANGDFNQSPDNRRKGRHPSNMRADIIGASVLLSAKTTLMNCDYRDVLDMAQSDDLVYLDPPYQGVCANRDPRYIQGISYEDFIEQLHRLNGRKIPYIVSYDGRTGDKQFGKPLPEFLELRRIEINAGRSSQATLLGQNLNTYESLYLSPALVDRLGLEAEMVKPRQLSLFGDFFLLAPKSTHDQDFHHRRYSRVL